MNVYGLLWAYQYRLKLGLACYLRAIRGGISRLCIWRGRRITRIARLLRIAGYRQDHACKDRRTDKSSNSASSRSGYCSNSASGSWILAGRIRLVERIVA